MSNSKPLTDDQCKYILDDNLHLVKTLNKSQLKKLNEFAMDSFIRKIDDFMKSKEFVGNKQ